MILKKADDKKPQIQALQSLLNIAEGEKKNKIQKELNILRAGIKGEQETNYHIDFNFGKSEKHVVIHDLRLESNGNVAQIDHLIIDNSLRVYCIETKHFNSGIKINESGEFMQWNSLKKVFEGIPSPFAQNQNHISVLDKIFDYSITLPEKLGVYLLYPRFHSRIVVNNSARIDRPKNFDSDNLVKSDQLYESIKKDSIGLSLRAMLKSVAYEVIEDIGYQLIKLHKPITFDYRAKFGIDKTEIHEPAQKSLVESNVNNIISSPKITEAEKALHVCKKCNSANVKIQYGKFGYYYKCGDCNGNTNIKIECSVTGHNAKLRKDGNQFYQECPECKSSVLYFQN